MKKLYKIALILMAAGTLLSLTSCNGKNEAAPEVTGEFKTAVLKVGQADAIVLKTENHTLLIDCGEKDDGGTIVDFLTESGVEKIDVIFITHFDKDHVGGFPKVLKNFEVGEVIVPDYEGTNKEYKKYLEALDNYNIAPMTLTENMEFILDDAAFCAYPPLKKSYAESDNDFSIAVSVTHGQNRFLFAGDAKEERLSEIIGQVKGTYTFLKVPHHGRSNKYSKRFFDAVKPEISVITCSDKNPEEEETVKALESVGSKVYLTRDGSVFVISDGKNLTVERGEADGDRGI